jgi:hypothetical protein
MADRFQREIPLDDPLLLKMIQEKAVLVEKGREISREMEELAKQHEQKSKEISSLAVKLNKHKLGIFKRVEKIAKKLLTDFEIPVTTAIKDGQVVLIATEALEEFKDSFNRFDKWHEPVPRKKQLDSEVA